jgi:four helix bundle protein
MKTFKDLKVWQKSMRIVQYIYKTTQKYPKNELFGLISQTRRCAVSIPCNIAEGYGRRSSKDYVRFLNISMGSLYELMTLLEVAHTLNFIEKTSFSQILNLTTEVGKMLNSLINKIQKSKSLDARTNA